MLQENQIIKKLSKFRAECICARCATTFVCSFYGARKSPIGHLCGICKNRIVSLTSFTQQDLLNVFTYNEHTGILKHKFDTASGMQSDIVGYKHSQGYLSTSVGKKAYLLHRLIWFMKTGNWPNQIDHIDHDRSNNRWKNLREVKSRDNQLNCSKSCNNTSGVTGVRTLPSGKFCAYIMAHRKQISLGSYERIEDAISARKQAEIDYGFHSNHGV